MAANMRTIRDQACIVVDVELDEQAGLLMISNLIEIDPAHVTIGLPVEVDFKAHS
jgi:uncharacterized OB-fold protein